MKLLAIVAAIFLPLNLIVGIYGMNFENMPELKWPWGYFAVLGIIVGAVLIVIWRFWSAGWINWGTSSNIEGEVLCCRQRKTPGTCQ